MIYILLMYYCNGYRCCLKTVIRTCCCRTLLDEDFHYSQVEGHREKARVLLYIHLYPYSGKSSHASTSSSNNNNMRTLQQLWANAGAQNSAASKSNYGDINDDDIDDDFLVQSIVSKPSDPLVSTSRAVLNTAGTYVDNTIDITASPPDITIISLKIAL